jgi:hypothetical protein
MRRKDVSANMFETSEMSGIEIGRLSSWNQTKLFGLRFGMVAIESRSVSLIEVIKCATCSMCFSLSWWWQVGHSSEKKPFRLSSSSSLRTYKLYIFIQTAEKQMVWIYPPFLDVNDNIVVICVNPLICPRPRPGIWQTPLEVTLEPRPGNRIFHLSKCICEWPHKYLDNPVVRN